MSFEVVPRHIAIIMDGNGRWAKQHGLPRFAGHKRGVDTVRTIARECADLGVEVLTLFAFSSENWRRPKEEVNLLMGLFIWVTKREAKKLHKENVRFRVIGDRSILGKNLKKVLEEVEQLTQHNTGLTLVVALNYGGQWDILQATKSLANKVASGEISSDQIDETLFESALSTANLPALDLLIRTSGEIRVSNFLIWQLAYAELYFTEVFWPAFQVEELHKALNYYAQRERRYGKTGDQLKG